MLTNSVSRMLELRPTCEHCTVPLDPTADDARICSFECTFCARCATWELLGICPNCGGELVARPRRPADALARNPASVTAVEQPVDLASHVEGVEGRLRADDLPTQVWTVSFCNRRPEASDGDGYAEAAERMDLLAAAQPGYLGIDSVRTDGGLGITVSRWSSIAAMVSWRKVVAHAEAQRSGRERWYAWYRSDVARVDRTSEFSA
jgi:uncharacterized protein